MKTLFITDTYDKTYTNRDCENSSDPFKDIYIYGGCKIKKILFGLAYKIEYFDKYAWTKDGRKAKRDKAGLNSKIILYHSGIKQVTIK